MSQLIGRYEGPIEAIIMDWAGTTVDFGSLAPIRGFQALFLKYGIVLTEEEVRIPMGTEKKEHIRQLCNMPRIQKAWFEKYAAEPCDSDINEMYAAFIPIQIASIAESAQLIQGVLALVDWAKSKAIKLGANTGYSREMVGELIGLAAEQGYSPQSIVCADEVTKGRPFPYMSMRNAMELEVSHLPACVKIDDTQPGIDEGLNAGMWTIALCVSGNEVGLSLEQWQALTKAEQDLSREKAANRFKGAHYTVDTIADVIPCLEEINIRLKRGEKP